MYSVTYSPMIISWWCAVLIKYYDILVVCSVECNCSSWNLLYLAVSVEEGRECQMVNSTAVSVSLEYCLPSLLSHNTQRENF